MNLSILLAISIILGTGIVLGNPAEENVNIHEEALALPDWMTPGFPDGITAPDRTHCYLTGCSNPWPKCPGDYYETNIYRCGFPNKKRRRCCRHFPDFLAQ